MSICKTFFPFTQPPFSHTYCTYIRPKNLNFVQWRLHQKERVAYKTYCTLSTIGLYRHSFILHSPLPPNILHMHGSGNKVSDAWLVMWILKTTSQPTSQPLSRPPSCSEDDAILHAPFSFVARRMCYAAFFVVGFAWENPRTAANEHFSSRDNIINNFFRCTLSRQQICSEY
jgi:hypothetical protein